MPSLILQEVTFGLFGRVSVAGDTGITDHNTHNETTHGGNVLADVELIVFMEKIDLPTSQCVEGKI